MAGRLYGVGVGPGDPELVTVKAARLIAAAGVVAYHAARHGRSNARAIAESYLRPDQIEEALIYPVTTETTDHPGGYQGAIDEFYAEAAGRLAVHLDAGRDVVVLAEGDPFFYGSYMHMHKRLAHRYETTVVPGVTSVSAAAAVLGRPLMERDEVLTVLPGTLPPDELAARLAGTESAAVMKLGRTFSGVRAALERAGRLDDAWYVERATTDRERFGRLADIDPESVPYFSLALLPSPAATAFANEPNESATPTGSALTGEPALTAASASPTGSALTGEPALPAASASPTGSALTGEPALTAGSASPTGSALTGEPALPAASASPAASALSAARALSPLPLISPSPDKSGKSEKWEEGTDRVEAEAEARAEAAADARAETQAGAETHAEAEAEADAGAAAETDAGAETHVGAEAFEGFGAEARGVVTVVGLGPGDLGWLTPEARAALADADDLIGYGPYLDRVAPAAGQRKHSSDNRVEAERAAFALDLAKRGRRVAVVSSGDPGVFAMAAAVLEVSEDPQWKDVPVRIVPGLTAAQAVASRVGAPLGHDFCIMSLSDRLKPWPVIADRLAAAAGADLVIAIYNPASKSRTEQLVRARELLLEHRDPQTPVVVGRDIGGPAESIRVTTLAELDPATIDMRCLLIIGSSQTRASIRGDGTPMVYTPRHYPADHRQAAHK